MGHVKSFLSKEFEMKDLGPWLPQILSGNGSGKVIYWDLDFTTKVCLRYVEVKLYFWMQAS